MNISTEEAIETIDAALFTGCDFENEKDLTALQYYLARWDRAAELISERLNEGAKK